MNNFSEHQVIKNDDGTYNVLDVPIFELGKHKGNDYDDKWAGDMLNNFQQLKEKKWLPRIIIGHNKPDGDEKPAFGFLDNLKLVGKKIHADYTNLKNQAFEALKDKSFPGRSVEVNPAKKKITALALLGGTEPHFQFEPVDVKFESDPEGEWISFEEKKSPVMDMLEKLLKVFTEKNESQNHGESEMTPEEKKQLIEEVKVEMQASFDEKFNQKYAEKFQEEFGKTPEQFKADQKAAKTNMFKEKKSGLIEKLKTSFNIAPAIVDGYFSPLIEAFADSEQTVKFAENEEGTVFEMMEKFGEALQKKAGDNSLIVDLSETAEHGGGEDNKNFQTGKFDITMLSEEETAELDKKIQKFADDNNISYEEAAVKVYAQLNEK